MKIAKVARLAEGTKEGEAIEGSRADLGSDKEKERRARVALASLLMDSQLRCWLGLGSRSGWPRRWGAWWRRRAWG